MSDELYDLEVTDRQAFIKFLHALHKDFLNDPESWENNTLPRFLEALSAYAEIFRDIITICNLAPMQTLQAGKHLPTFLEVLKYTNNKPAVNLHGRQITKANFY